MKKISEIVKFNFLFFLILFLFSSCKTDNKHEKYISKIDISKDLANFTSKLTEKDTIIIDVNLSMEYWIRLDKITILKKGNTLKMKTEVKKDTSYRLKYEFLTEELSERTIELNNKKIEDFFIKRIKRTVKTEDDKYWIYRIINQEDTLKFYSKGLGDKGGEVHKYFDLMKNFYPYNVNYTWDMKTANEESNFLNKGNSKISIEEKKVDKMNVFFADSTSLILIPSKIEKNKLKVNETVIFYDSITERYFKKKKFSFLKTNKRYIRFLSKNGKKIYVDTHLVNENQTLIINNENKPYSIKTKDFVEYIYN